MNTQKTAYQKLQDLGMSSEYATELLQLHSKNFWKKSDLLEMVAILKEAYEEIPDTSSKKINSETLQWEEEFRKEFGPLWGDSIINKDALK